MRYFFSKSLLLFSLLLLTSATFSQENRPAQYVDGVEGLKEFFEKNLDLRPFNLKKDFRGTIVLRLQVNFLGGIDSMYVWFSPSKELGEEALRVLEMTRNSWTPRRKDGGFANAWVQFPYHICRTTNCGYTSGVYNENIKKSRKAFLGGDREKGIDLLRNAVNAEPTHGDDFYRLAKLLMEEGRDPYICRYLEIAQELTGNLYPEYFEYCNEEKEEYLSRRQEEDEDFNSYMGVSPTSRTELGDWQAGFPGDKPDISYRYPGGADSLRRFLSMNIRFPALAAQHVQGGHSVSSITISPEGQIEKLVIMNSLGASIDREVFKVLQKTRGHWRAVDLYPKSQTYVVQINFSYNAECTKEDHVVLHSDTVLREVRVCAINYHEQIIPNEEIKSRVGNLIFLEKYSEALPYLDEGFHRDPFNAYYPEQKALCYGELGWVAREARILGMLENFRAGDSLVFLGLNQFTGSRRIVRPTKKGGYSVREIRLDSSIVYSGVLASLDPEIRDGKFYFFHENGTVEVSGEYRNNNPVGIWNNYSPTGEVETFLDYSDVFSFLRKEEANRFVDSAYLGRTDLGANDNGTFATAQKMPVFRGSDPAYSFQQYLKKAIKYPKYAWYYGIEGTVEVQFTIDQNGQVREPVVVKGVHPDLNLEALRVIINSPQWSPGKMGKKPVAVVYTFPVNFYEHELFQF